MCQRCNAKDLSASAIERVLDSLKHMGGEEIQAHVRGNGVDEHMPLYGMPRRGDTVLLPDGTHGVVAVAMRSGTQAWIKLEEGYTRK